MTKKNIKEKGILDIKEVLTVQSQSPLDQMDRKQQALFQIRQEFGSDQHLIPHKQKDPEARINVVDILKYFQKIGNNVDKLNRGNDFKFFMKDSRKSEYYHVKKAWEKTLTRKKLSYQIFRHFKKFK